MEEYEDSLTLKPHQVEHYDRILDILRKWYVYVDSTPTGGGKTVISICVAKTLGLDLIIICPPTIQDGWYTHAEKYNVKILNCISYQALRGVKGRDLNHGKFNLLHKDDEEKYHPTKDLLEYLKKGVMIVFDEFHSLKNENTIQLDASHCIVNTVVTSGTRSKVALVSATPADKIKNSFPLIKMMGLCFHNELFTNIEGKHKPTGFFQIYKMAEHLDSDKTKKILPITDLKQAKDKDMTNIMFNFFKDIFVNQLSSSSEGVKLNVNDYRRNGFFHFHEQDVARLVKIYDSLSNDLHYDYNKNDMRIDKTAFTNMTRTLVELEKCKVRTMVRLAEETLDKNKNNKVIIYFNYKVCIFAAERALKEFKPMMLYGEITKEKRNENIRKFQKHSNEHRLLICHPKVAGVGLSLHDTHGSYPRTQFVSPTYDFIITHQIAGRTYRTGSMSDSETYLVFCKEVPEEQKLINCLGGKAKNAKVYANKEKEERIVFPGEYEFFNEPEKKIYDDNFEIYFDE